jgi:hypothetical protein
MVIDYCTVNDDNKGAVGMIPKGTEDETASRLIREVCSKVYSGLSSSFLSSAQHEPNPMQIFTPTQLHQNPAKVFRAADKDGSVLIKHDRYPDVEFVLTAKEKSK